ncbi:MAG: hypothetical protein R2761_16080 [Acidimicrobiales bacterium]
MSIATDMATEWLRQVAAPSPGDHLQRNARRAELLGAGTHLVQQLLAEIDEVKAYVAELQAEAQR